GVERAPERIPRVARLVARSDRLVHVLGTYARCLERSGAADGVWKPLREASGLPGELARLVPLAVESQIDRARGGRLNRLRDEPGALADVERLRKRRERPRDVPGVAQGQREAVQRPVGDLGPAGFLGHPERSPVGLLSLPEVTDAPAEKSMERIGVGHVADETSRSATSRPPRAG